MNINEDQFRKPLKILNKGMVFLWQTGLAGWLNIWPAVFGRFLVISHKGRKTRKIYHNMVNYAELDGEFYCLAGFGAKTDWYQNLKANPQTEVWLKDGWFQANAEEVNNDLNRISILREVLIGSGIVAPLIGINVAKLDDTALGEITSNYRLIHLKQESLKTDSSRQYQYVWIWQVIAGILALELIRKRKNK